MADAAIHEKPDDGVCSGSKVRIPIRRRPYSFRCVAVLSQECCERQPGETETKVGKECSAVRARAAARSCVRRPHERLLANGDEIVVVDERSYQIDPGLLSGI